LGELIAGKLMDKPFTGHQETQLSALLAARIDALILGLTALPLLAAAHFPRPVSAAALLLLLAPSIARLMMGRPLARPSAANLPVALLAFVFLPLAFLMSPAPWGVAWSRLTTLAWSIALFFVVANWPRPGAQAGLRTRIGGPTRVYLGLGLAVAVIGALGMRSVDKLFSLPAAGILAEYLGWESGLPTNEIAGVLTLFIPFTAALATGCLLTGRRRQALILLPLTLLMAATLALTQSRTGLAATVAGVALALAVSGIFSRRWIAGGLIVAGAGLLLAALTPLADWFIFAGANSWNSVIGPRLGIWNQAFDAIRDHPLWGVGLGEFGRLARSIYPLVAPADGPLLEDAHNLYLQTALDLGVAGLLVFLCVAAIVMISAVRLARNRPPRTLGRLWAAGLLGALVAHALYSLTDAVALGTLAGAPLWFLFGLVMGGTSARLRLAWSSPARIALAGGLLLALGLSLPALRVNRAGQLAAHALLDPAADAGATAVEIGRLAEGECRARWFEGLLRDAAGDMAGRAAAWGALLDCTGDYLAYMPALAANDVELATRAVAARPDDAAAYFWLAAARAADAPAAAIELYRQGLALAPADGRRWLALADLLQPIDPVATENAYMQACVHGDPGANGCLRAGELAEQRGDPRRALEYYRLSNWSGAREKADALERQLGQP
jgi:putative inorganic carbon (HCO3(-)) transporter